MNADRIKSMANRIMVCGLSTGTPGFKRQNKEEAAAVAQKHGVSEEKTELRFNHCKHKSLDEWSTLCREARMFHNRMTMPAVDNTCAILPMGKEMEYMDGISKFQTAGEPLKAAFMADYPRLMAEAPVTNNGMHDSSVWKRPEVIAAKFKLKAYVRPCPTEGEWKSWLVATAESSVMDIQEELEKRLRHLIERLVADDCKGRLFQSAFDGLKEIAELAPGFNLLDDPKLQAMAAQAHNLADYDKDDVVKDKGLRKSIAADANRLLSMFTPPQAMAS